jgi:hypothetical protein
MKIKLLSITILFSISLMSANLQAQKFKQPILISSAGQSADVKLVKLLAQKQKLNANTVLMAKPSDLTGMNTLIIVPGFSSKGLGAAGISQQDEMDRVQNLIKSANEMKVPVILVHIGGNARRKGQSDAFNQVVGDISKCMIVVKQGDEDGFFTTISKGKNIPLTLVEKITDAEIPLGNLFK